MMKKGIFIDKSIIVNSQFLHAQFTCEAKLTIHII